MKVCEVCGDMIATPDGENRCRTCEEAADAKQRAVLLKRRADGRARDAAMRSLGLTKVRGAMGGVYWE